MKHLIEKPEDLTPQTKWLDTKWAWTGEEALIDHTCLLYTSDAADE